MNKLNVVTTVVLGSMLISLGTVSALGLFPKIGSAASETSAAKVVVTFADSEAEVITSSGATLALGTVNP